MNTDRSCCTAAEAVHFAKAHFAHVAAWEERQRLARIMQAHRTARGGRTAPRAAL